MIWATWTAFRDQPEIVVLRVVFSLTIATTLGWLFGTQRDPRPLLQPALANALPDNKADPNSTPALLQKGTFILGGTTAQRFEALAYQTTLYYEKNQVDFEPALFDMFLDFIDIEEEDYFELLKGVTS